MIVLATIYRDGKAITVKADVQFEAKHIEAFDQSWNRVTLSGRAHIAAMRALISAGSDSAGRALTQKLEAPDADA
jgi:hypothetical protein